MNPREKGFLLLSSNLGDPLRKPLTTAQLRTLADRAWQMDVPEDERDLVPEDLMALGYGQEMARRIVSLLEQEDLLDYYIKKAAAKGCYPITRVSEHYPLVLRKRLGLDAPGVLWAKGDVSILEAGRIGFVGSRDLMPENKAFAAEAGHQAALQGYTLVSGNARGADQTAQNACLKAGGQVISVVADDLSSHHSRENVLYLSLDEFDSAFSAQRALSRNRVIHALGKVTLVAQCNLKMGGTWDGSVKNLTHNWSPLFCFDDGSAAMEQLVLMGASYITKEQLNLLDDLQPEAQSLFE